MCEVDARLDRSERMEQTEPASQLSADIQYMYVIAFSIFIGVWEQNDGHHVSTATELIAVTNGYI